jgi:hypothetical protein
MGVAKGVCGCRLIDALRRAGHVRPVHVIGHLGTRADRDLPGGQLGRKIGPGKFRGESGNPESAFCVGILMACFLF